MLKELLCLFFVVNGFSMNDETGCTGSCEAKWTFRITSGVCICCCLSSVLQMIPSEGRPVLPKGFFEIKPEEELAFGTFPWLVAGVPATFANYNYDGIHVSVVIARPLGNVVKRVREILARNVGAFF